MLCVCYSITFLLILSFFSAGVPPRWALLLKPCMKQMRAGTLHTLPCRVAWGCYSVNSASRRSPVLAAKTGHVNTVTDLILQKIPDYARHVYYGHHCPSAHPARYTNFGAPTTNDTCRCGSDKLPVCVCMLRTAYRQDFARRVIRVHW